MCARAEILFKDYSLKNSVGAPYLADFLYIRMLSLISGGDSASDVTLHTKGAKFVVSGRMRFSYVNELPPHLFSNLRKFDGAQVALLKNVRMGVFFWSTLIGLSFLSSNIRLHKLYKSVPGGLRTQIINTVSSNLNTPTRFFLNSNIHRKSVGGVPVSLRSGGLQFIGAELPGGLMLKSEFYFKNFMVVGQFFPIMFNVFTIGFSEKFFYPYYRI